MSRTVNRAAGNDESQNKAVKHATGVLEYDTKPIKRDRNWKLYRKSQYKQK